MNGADIKKAAINKAKAVAQAANGNGGKKRRKGQDLKPIITTESQKSQDGSPASSGSFHYKCVLLLRLHCLHGLIALTALSTPHRTLHPLFPLPTLPSTTPERPLPHLPRASHVAGPAS